MSAPNHFRCGFGAKNGPQDEGDAKQTERPRDRYPELVLELNQIQCEWGLTVDIEPVAAGSTRKQAQKASLSNGLWLSHEISSCEKVSTCE